MILTRPWAAFALFALTACVAPEDAKAPSAAEDFAAFCAPCHGETARGDGPAAEGLSPRPKDLTAIAARRGGTYPATEIMAKIWGYTGGRDGARVMPKFGALLQSEVVPYDGGDGILTPTPLRLVQLADYLKAIQGRKP